MLIPTQYRSCDGDNIDSKSLLTRKQLESLVAASTNEIESALKILNVVKFGNDGHIRMLAIDILNESIRAILDAIIENGWCIDHVDELSLRSQLEIDKLFYDHFFLKYCHPVQSGIWSIPYEVVARLTADMLFRYKADNSKVRFHSSVR